MVRTYLGLACTCHDPALAIVDETGQIRFAEAAERYLQNKRAWHAPPDDLVRVDRLLETYAPDATEIVMAKSWSPRSRRRRSIALPLLALARRVQVALQSVGTARQGDAPPLSQQRRQTTEVAFLGLQSAGSAVDRASMNLQLQHALQPLKRSASRSYSRVLRQQGFDHHLTHAATGCFTSPFADAVCAVIDGFGETGSTAYFAYRAGQVKALNESPHSSGSLGFFYFLLCYACGFEPLQGEEWKVMGLAPYGTFRQEIYSQLQELCEIRGLQVRWKVRWTRLIEAVKRLQAFEPADLACTGQQIFEDWMVQLLQGLAALQLSDNLVLTGGVALNSTLVGKLSELTPFRQIHVPCAPADDGNAIGAAFLAFQSDHPDWTPDPGIQCPYLGSSISSEVKGNLIDLGRVPNLSVWPENIARKGAELLAAGKIVGWVQGRAEFGPRALGNRSILADPRRSDMKDEINRRVKFREEFRPFAPSILHEFGPAYFENYQETRYMERTLRFRPEVTSRIPAVVHFNGTGRLQSVKRGWNPLFYELIEQFHAITGVPILLNTSFNVMGKPIIHSLEDAIAVFYTTGLDALIVDDLLIEK